MAETSLLPRLLEHRSAAPLAAWESSGEMLLPPLLSKARREQTASSSSLLPRVVDKQEPGGEATASSELLRSKVVSASTVERDGAAEGRPRRVSWQDRRSKLFGGSILSDEVEARTRPSRGSRETAESSRDDESPGWRWKSSVEPDEVALRHLFGYGEDAEVSCRRENSGLELDDVAEATPATTRIQPEEASSDVRPKSTKTKKIQRRPLIQQRIPVAAEDRFMQCSCCSRKKDGRPASAPWFGVERQLSVENSTSCTVRAPRSSTLTTMVVETKPPMRFGANREEVLRKVAALKSSKARFTVLPVITVSKNGKRREFSWQNRGCKRRVPVSCRECLSSRGKSTAPATELSAPRLNSTARLLQRLEETKKGKFNLGSAGHWCSSQGGKEHAALGIKRPTSSKSDDSELVHCYKDLCKISEPPVRSSDRAAARKQRTEVTITLRRKKKPSVSDLWVPSEQCPQVCSTAPIRIEPSDWLQLKSDPECEREALCRGAQDAMSRHFGLQALF